MFPSYIIRLSFMSFHPLKVELTVEAYLRGMRVDRFLMKHFRNYSAWRMQRMIQAGCARLDGRVLELDERLYFGQRIEFHLIEPPDKLLPPESIELEILFEDPWLMVVNKPAGMICHPTGDFQAGSLCNAVQAHLDRQTPFPGMLRPGIVHRLDRQTSGAIAVPKEHLSHRRVSIEFQRERVSKSYLALVEGVISRDEFTIDLPIGQARGDTILMSAKAGAIDARPSKTRIRVLRRFERHTFVEAKPFTGRNHQIRVHLAEAGFPIVADEYYEAGGRLKAKRPDLPDDWQPEDDVFPNAVDPATGLTRHFLHAYRLAFAHPMTEEWMEFHAPLTSDLRAALYRLGMKLKSNSFNHH
jgi:23S rRNA pseudouridine1911/1915/1917 synthase